VLNLQHHEHDFDTVTKYQKQAIFPFLAQSLHGNEQTILDFGCGPGRFTTDLASMVHGRAIGVDVIAPFLRIAPVNPHTLYMQIPPNTIPVQDSSIDVLWCCLVLGGVTDLAILRRLLQEFERVLKREGLLFLIENTAMKPDAPHWHFRKVEDYISLVPFVQLVHLHDYIDAGERISVMGGRNHVV
jgi:ubiquinone/menaquinone biosynthesis C-methylase UbiE